MIVREHKKKSISEFYTVRENNAKSISCITTKYRYGNAQDPYNIKYVSKAMKKSNSKLEVSAIKDKYRIFSGKLHKFDKETQSYMRIDRNDYIDISKHAERVKNDYTEKRNTLARTSQNWIIADNIIDLNSCTRETQRQKKSSVLLLSRSSKTSKNFYMTQNKPSYKTASEILSERLAMTSYEISR
jgi:hypothetical protein